MWALLIIVKLVVSHTFTLITSKNHPKFDVRIFFSHGKNRKKTHETATFFPSLKLAGTLIFSGNSQWFNHQPVLRPRPRPCQLAREATTASSAAITDEVIRLGKYIICWKVRLMEVETGDIIFWKHQKYRYTSRIFRITI